MHTEANLRELDVAAAGPVVRQVFSVFHHFWNGTWAAPISAFVDRPHTEADLRAALNAMRESIAADDHLYSIDEDTAALKSTLETEIDRLISTPGQTVWDDPVEIVETGGISHMLEVLHGRAGRLETGLLIETSHFVPRDRGIEKMRTLHDRGLRIRVLTNSLDPNDVLAAHAGDDGRRKQVLEREPIYTSCARMPGRSGSGSPSSEPKRPCTPRSSSATARICSSAASTSTRARRTPTPRPGCTSRVQSWPPG